MSGFIKGEDRSQATLFPERLDDYVAEDSYADSEWGNESILQSDYGTMQSVSTTMLTNGNSINYGGVILDPDNNDIVFAVLRSGGLMKMELSTFNNFVFSW